MNRYTPIARTPLVRIVRFDHPPDPPHADPAEEVETTFSLTFVERGHFDIRMGRTRQSFRPGMVLVGRRGQVYRCHHDRSAPTDSGLVVEFGDRAAEELLGAAGRRLAYAPSNRLVYGRLRLLAAADGADPLAIETRAGELLETIDAFGDGGARLFGEERVAWYARRVDAARQLLETTYAERHALPGLARSVGMSPFHFARVFRELVGAPPHRHLLAIRLRQAARRIRDGVSVTDACFEVGFANLSHFTRSFRRRYGVPPSRFSGPC